MKHTPSPEPFKGKMLSCLTGPIPITTATIAAFGISARSPVSTRLEKFTLVHVFITASSCPANITSTAEI